MAAPFPYVNKLVTPAMYAIQRTKFLSDVAAMRVDRAGLMPFDKLADSPVYNSTADFVTRIVYHLNPHARFASWAMILLVHTLTQLGGNRWAELCVASRSFMQFRTPPVTARTSAAADPNIDESEPYSFVADQTTGTFHVIYSGDVAFVSDADAAPHLLYHMTTVKGFMEISARGLLSSNAW